jgi:UDPglucose 6-dehydrogenase
MNDAVVYGLGTVGKSTAKAFSIPHYFSRSESNITLKDASFKRYHFFCLPTPTINGDCFRDDTFDLIRQLEQLPHNQNVYIIRSTVIPGTAKYIISSLNVNSVVSNPEFLSEDTADEDAIHPDIVVIGGEHKQYVDDVAGIYQGHIKTAKIFTTDTITAEISKYAINTFYATKVVFANQIFDVCQHIGANYETVKEIMYNRKWIGRNHLDIWNKGGRGAGGKCLKKDLDAFENYSKSKLLEIVRKINNELLSKYPKKDKK